MNLKQASVLITGGSDGIGRALAERYLSAGSKVVVTGRNEEKLETAKRELPGVQTVVSDISVARERESLAKWVAREMPDLNVLINNAGIQRRISLASDKAEWSERQVEIDTLFSGPVHLSHLLIPVMLKNKLPGMIVNVTSGGGFIPQVFAPIYSASKAALHSYTVTLRHALKETNVRVVELIPPAVQTALAGAGASHGAPLSAFIDAVFTALQADQTTTAGFGPTSSPEFLNFMQSADKLFEASASRFPVAVY